MEAKTRAPGVKVPISAVLKGRLVQEDDSPTFLDLGKQVFRVSIMGVVVEAEGKAFTLDDGSGKLPVRSFDELRTPVSVGMLIQVLGRVRTYQGERYLVPDVLSEITEGWMRVRKKELEGREFPAEEEEGGEGEVAEEAVEGGHEALLDFIRKHDTGQGVSTEQVVAHGVKEETIELMLKEGEIFENRPGYVKVLE